jgi:hypothetical protein
VILVAGGFFGAKALSHDSNAAASVATGNSGAAPNGGGRGGRPGTVGTITSISGNTLTVKSAATNTNVDVTASDTTRVTASTTVPVSAIVDGDRIVVTGSASGTTVSATAITDLGSSTGSAPNGGPGGNAGPAGDGGGVGTGPGNRSGGLTSGTVTGTTSGAITISVADGTTTTVQISPSTLVTKNVESSVGALEIGDSVRVSGTAATDGSVAATSISEGATAGFGGGAGPNGPPGTGTAS